jgi:hypothetical protein
VRIMPLWSQCGRITRPGHPVALHRHTRRTAGGANQQATRPNLLDLHGVCGCELRWPVKLIVSLWRWLRCSRKSRKLCLGSPSGVFFVVSLVVAWGERLAGETGKLVVTLRQPVSAPRSMLLDPHSQSRGPRRERANRCRRSWCEQGSGTGQILGPAD